MSAPEHDSQHEPNEPFAAPALDHEIVSFLALPPAAVGADSDSDARLIHALAIAHRLPDGADAVLHRVRARLSAAPSPVDADDGDDLGDFSAGEGLASLPPHWSSARHGSRATAAMRTLAAGLVIALLAGGYLALLRSRGTEQVPPPQARGWRDASITTARTSHPLDFHSSDGISYAVATTGGTVYACGSGHLWYSTDGGATYQSFTPELPPPPAIEQPLPSGATLDRCVIVTVPGLPGVFAFERVIGLGQDLPRAIGYATPGSNRWQDIPMTPNAQSVNPPPSQGILLDPYSIAQQLAYDGTAQASQGWLYLPLHQQNNTPSTQVPNLLLIGTPDFGGSWYWIDSTLFRQHALSCARVVVQPDDARRIACEVDNGDGTHSIWLTTDRGASWVSLPAPSIAPAHLAAITSRGVYATTDPTPEASGGLLLRLPDLTAGWRLVAPFPSPAAALAAGTEREVAVGRDGAVYVAQRVSDEASTTVQVDMLPKGASRFVSVAPARRFTPARGGVAFGGLDGQTPTVYLGAAVSFKGSVAPLERLALVPSSLPSPVYTPVPTVAPTAEPPTPRPQCAKVPITLAANRPGGLGAPVSTFPAVWGQPKANPGGREIFTLAGGTLTLDAPAGDGRASGMTYTVYPNVTLSLAQAQSLARQLMPTDAREIYIGAPVVHPIAHAYCSGGLWAAFPPGTYDFTMGTFEVDYYTRTDGKSVDHFTIALAMLG
ncbi:MAG TPA: hypothetical protein VFU88_20000 [Ktedonobacterales bacterium]|nr:hypothetical protein [Ktedonobacterales bacterium]